MTRPAKHGRQTLTVVVTAFDRDLPDRSVM